jgi:hypothetical protein
MWMSVGDRMEAVGNLTEEGHSAREISEENLTSRRPVPSKADRRAVKEAELAGGRRARAGAGRRRQKNCGGRRLHTGLLTSIRCNDLQTSIAVPHTWPALAYGRKPAVNRCGRPYDLGPTFECPKTRKRTVAWTDSTRSRRSTGGSEKDTR